jgi:hypothetical protein
MTNCCATLVKCLRLGSTRSGSHQVGGRGGWGVTHSPWQITIPESPVPTPGISQSPWGRVGTVEMNCKGPAGRLRQLTEDQDGGTARDKGNEVAPSLALCLPFCFLTMVSVQI